MQQKNRLLVIDSQNHITIPCENAKKVLSFIVDYPAPLGGVAAAQWCFAQERFFDAQKRVNSGDNYVNSVKSCDITRAELSIRLLE